MNYAVILQPRAIRDLEEAYLWSARRAPDAAARWLDRFHAALQTLSTNPQRCGIAPENDVVEQEIRQFLFGKYPNVWRALFVIRDNEVRVLHVRRALMQTAAPEDLRE
jgi:plasmid stabilization system protein ParE